MRPSERSRRRRAAGGFAMVWVLLLVGVMGLGLAGAVRIEANVAQRAKERSLLSIGHQFRNAIASYYENTSGGRTREYPASLDDLLKDNRTPGLRRHLRQVFVDPFTGKAEWGFLLLAGRIAGVHSLSDEVPIKQAGFEPEDMGFAGKQKISDWVFTYPSDLVNRPASAAEPAAAASGVPGENKP